jgi:UDP-glucose 4-epimerase
MRALVTGGAGFIGSHIVDSLLLSGAHVAVLDDLSTGRAENVRPGVRLYRVRVQDPGLDGVISSERPEVVFHQAAQVSVPASIRAPLADGEVNLLGTINLIEACLRHGAPKIVFASSAAVYGQPVYLPIDEEHPVAPLAPYGVSKLAAEFYLAMYARTRGLHYTVLRYANVYGPRQDAAGEGGVVAIFAGRLRRGEPPAIFGDGGQTRDFVHVRDVAAANRLAAAGGDGQVFNIGTGARITVNTLWETFCRVAGRRLAPVYAPPRPGDILHSSLSPEKARRELAWRAETALDKGLEETLAGFK